MGTRGALLLLLVGMASVGCKDEVTARRNAFCKVGVVERNYDECMATLREAGWPPAHELTVDELVKAPTKIGANEVAAYARSCDWGKEGGPRAFARKGLRAESENTIVEVAETLAHDPVRTNSGELGIYLGFGVADPIPPGGIAIRCFIPAGKEGVSSGWKKGMTVRVKGQISDCWGVGSLELNPCVPWK